MNQFVAGIEAIREVRTYTFQLSALATGMMLFSIKMHSEAVGLRTWAFVFLAFQVVSAFLAMHFFITAFNASHILSNELLLATNESRVSTTDFWEHFYRLNDSVVAVSIKGGNAFMTKTCVFTFLCLAVATIMRGVTK